MSPAISPGKSRENEAIRLTLSMRLRGEDSGKCHLYSVTLWTFTTKSTVELCQFNLQDDPNMIFILSEQRKKKSSEMQSVYLVNAAASTKL